MGSSYKVVRWLLDCYMKNGNQSMFLQKECWNKLNPLVLLPACFQSFPSLSPSVIHPWHSFLPFQVSQEVVFFLLVFPEKDCCFHQNWRMKLPDQPVSSELEILFNNLWKIRQSSEWWKSAVGYFHSTARLEFGLVPHQFVHFSPFRSEAEHGPAENIADICCSD